MAIHLDGTLARDPDVEITLVNRDNFFLLAPMLHEVAASDLDLTNIVNPIRKLLKRINFLAGEVEAINLEQKIVTVSHGFDHHHHDIPFDHVVIGLGSLPRSPNSNHLVLLPTGHFCDTQARVCGTA